MIHAVLNELGLVCALGRGKSAVREALASGRAPGMHAETRLVPDGRPFHVGQVEGPLPSIAHVSLRHRSRNNQLLLAALEEIRGPVDAALRAFGPGRVGVVLGTSTSGIAEAENAYLARDASGALPASFHYGQMEVGSPSEFLSAELGLSGPSFTVSTACSSSAKALASARRLLRSGLCDAVVAGGADSLCRFTQAGFMALGAVSQAPCAPFGKDRQGINIGEGAALFLMTRDGPGPRLQGVGESSDAHHISAPEPGGRGAALAMTAALADAGLAPSQIDYLNAHGTATAQNDAMEALAIHRVLGPKVPVSSTKPLSGHALGAAGALEAAFCWLLLTSPEPCALPPQLGSAAFDDSLAAVALVPRGQDGGAGPRAVGGAGPRAVGGAGSRAVGGARPRAVGGAGSRAVGGAGSRAVGGARPRAVMSNSFGFGGSNASLVLVGEA